MNRGEDMLVRGMSRSENKLFRGISRSENKLVRGLTRRENNKSMLHSARINPLVKRSVSPTGCNKL